MKKCIVCDSTFQLRGINKFGNYYCNRHFKQMSRHGRILDRTIYDKNEIIYGEDCAYIILYNKSFEEVGRAIIDKKNVKLVENYKWSMDGEYAWCTSINLSLHRLIIGYDGNMDVDHINRNKLDNRESNLRIVSHADNSKNIKLPTDNKTGIIGVSWDNSRNKWKVEIKADGKRYNIGRFSDFKEAVVARLKHEKELFREFSPQKHLFEIYGI